MSKKSSGTRSKSTAMRKKSTATTKTTKKSSAKPTRQKGAQGISNRMSAGDEARDQKRHPPIDAGSPPAEDAAGRKGERLTSRRGQTSHKAGSRSIAQKQANTRYPDRSMPAARKTAGAFGREPGRASATRARAGTSRPKRKRA